MYKAFLFNILLLLVLGGSVYASETIVAEMYGKEKPKSFLLESNLKTEKQLNSFSLRSDMQFRGEEVIKSTSNYNYISLNTSVTYQKGRNNYVLPYRKSVILNRITFNPNSNYSRNYQR